MSLETTLFRLTLLLYFLAAVAYHAQLFAGSERGRKLALCIVPLGVLLHTAAIGVWCMRHGSVLRDPGMPFSMTAYFIAIAQIVANLRRQWSSIGSISMPLAFAAQCYADVIVARSGAYAPESSAFLRPHVMAPILAFAAFALAFCLAVIYLIEARLLKQKKLGGLFSRLPPLESISTGAHWLAVVGFSMLTMGMITGAMVAPSRWGPEWYLTPHVLVSLFAWVVYAVYLALRGILGWRGRKVTYFLLAGFAAVLVAFIFAVVYARPTPSRAGAAPEPAVLAAAYRLIVW